MKFNIGLTDKLIRYALGVSLISLHLAGIVSGVLGIIVLITAAIVLLTGLFNFCPIYLALGWSTWRGEHREKGKY